MTVCLHKSVTWLNIGTQDSLIITQVDSPSSQHAKKPVTYKEWLRIKKIQLIAFSNPRQLTSRRKSPWNGIISFNRHTSRLGFRAINEITHKIIFIFCTSFIIKQFNSPMAIEWRSNHVSAQKCNRWLNSITCSIRSKISHLAFLGIFFPGTGFSYWAYCGWDEKPSRFWVRWAFLRTVQIFSAEVFYERANVHTVLRSHVELYVGTQSKTFFHRTFPQSFRTDEK